MRTTITPRLRKLVMGRMAEPHRHYHGQSHVDAMLDGLRELGPAVRRPGTVELAVWYHDAVHDPARSDNEERSAALLLSETKGTIDHRYSSDAAAMVLATRGHAVPPDTRPDLASDMAHMLDLDMAVLGSSPDVYDAYERGIAAEYVPVHGAERYARGRRAFLEGMLARTRIFLTARAHERLDADARANIARTLAGT